MAFRKPAPQYDPRPGKDTSPESKDISNNSLAFLTHAMPARHRSGSTASTRSNKSTHKSDNKTTSTPLNPAPVNNSNSSAALLPPLLPRNATDNNSTHSKQSHHHHIRLPSFLRRGKHSAPESSSSSPSSTPASSTLQLSLQQHTIVMVPQHDIHITWSHPVPSGNAFIAGTWSVPGHGPWEKLPMTRIPGTDSFEVHLDVQEIEDISDYLDEDGYLHHELPDHHHHAHDHTQQGSPPLTPSSTTSPTRMSRRQRLSRFFGRARSSSSASTTSTTASKDLHIDLPHHHQSKDGTFSPILQKYRYQYKFVIDDEWKCDHDQPQVQDPHGNSNHELVVELIEQTASDAVEGRSRSSSLQSQHGPQISEHSLPLPTPTVITTASDPSATTTTTTTTTIDTPTSIIISPAEEDKKKEDEIKEEIPRETTENVAVSTPVPASNFVTASAPVAPAIPTSTTSTTRRSNLKSRDTYEAVLIFDETDDLSDGEGRSKHQAQIESDDDSDEEDVKEDVKEDEKAIEDLNNINTDNNNNNNNNNSATELLGEDVAKVNVDITPQQDDHAALSPADQDHYPLGEESSVIIGLSVAEAAADDDDTTPASAPLAHAVVSSDIALLTEETAAAAVSKINPITELVVQEVEEKKEAAAVEEEEKEAESAIAPIEDIFVNSSSVAESLPQLDEPSIIVPAGSIAVEEEEEEEEEEKEKEQETVTPAPIAVNESIAEEEMEQEAVAPTPIAIEEAKVVPEVEAEKVTVVERALEEIPAPVVLSPVPASVAIPASPVFSFSSATANSHLLSPDVEPEAFVLQAAVNFDEDLSMDDDGGVSEAEELESSIQEVEPAATKTVPEVIIDATSNAATTAIAAAIATATVAAATTTAAPLSVTTTATDYSQVPSPPLTPSTLNSSKRDLIAEHITTVETKIEGEKQQQQQQETFERSVYMTPRPENTFTKHTTFEETTTTTTVEDENATIDILEDKDLPASLLSGSSSTSSLSTLNGGNYSRRSTSTKHSTVRAASPEKKSREVEEHHDKKKGGLPEQYPNLFWSICKTTAVVTTAVVILGLGLGRRRD